MGKMLGICPLWSRRDALRHIESKGSKISEFSDEQDCQVQSLHLDHESLSMRPTAHYQKMQPN